MSGNPYVSNTDTKPYREAHNELVNGKCVRRLNELHVVNDDEIVD